MPQLQISFEASDLRKTMSQHELIDFILEIDRSVQGVDFTIDVIKSLIDSLQHDESIEWIADELGFKVKE